MVFSLLKETENLEDKRLLEMGDERGRLHLDEDAEGDHKKLLSRYGVWLLVQLVPVKADISFVGFMPLFNFILNLFH